jgi:hypothetical protein
VQSIPEAQYQDEFYRCAHVHSGGSVAAFPEFGTTRGRVDFYMKSKKWAIELLRNGDRLEEHVKRFTQGGKYSGLDIDDYVVLDCRTTTPAIAHPSKYLCFPRKIVLFSLIMLMKIWPSCTTSYSRIAIQRLRFWTTI